MVRHVQAVVVVLADIAIVVAGHGGVLPVWVGLGYAAAVGLVIALRYRSPTAAFVAALILASVTGGAYVLLLWCAYEAGREVLSRSGTVVLVGAALGSFAVQLVTKRVDAPELPQLAFIYIVFIALPVLVGRYLAQHHRLVTTLDRHNRQLRQQRELRAEQERLRERLRIARDMHDSLGHRLSLVSVQAAALEVSDLPPAQQQAVRHLAQSARAAMNELYELVGGLRGDEAASSGGPAGLAAIGELVAEFQASGMPVTLRHGGGPRPIEDATAQAVYRVVQEGLTNAIKHAPGQPVTVSVQWELDALLVTVCNPIAVTNSVSVRDAVAERPGPAVVERPGPPVVGTEGGRGLAGLGERVGACGGFVDHRRSADEFRLVAMLPAAEELELDKSHPVGGRLRTAALGFATAGLMFVVLPVGMLMGARW